MWRSLINIQIVSRFKTVNGKEACTTVVSDTQSRSLRRFKTVNGKEACTTTTAAVNTVKEGVSKP